MSDDADNLHVYLCARTVLLTLQITICLQRYVNIVNLMSTFWPITHFSRNMTNTAMTQKRYTVSNKSIH